MKNLLALSILSTLVVSEETEYPIELTCEVSSNIFQIYLSDVDDESWLMNISGITQIMPGVRDNKVKIKNFKITDDEIIVKQRIKMSAGNLVFNINRYSGGIIIFNTHSQGKCTKGFKEYNEKQI